MNKIGFVIRREFESRVKKKSFLLATILIPLIFPAVLGGMIYFAVLEQENAEAEKIYLLDESGLFELENDDRYTFTELETSLEEAKNIFSESDAYGLLYIPEIKVEDPDGVILYGKKNPSLQVSRHFEKKMESIIRDIKLTRSGISEEQLASLKTNVSLRSISLSEGGEEKESSATVAFGLAYAFSFLIYMFVLIYGSQIMQGVIEEKSSKIVEIIVSSVKPFQLMMGKVIGVASVGLLQFLIWVVLIFGLSTLIFSIFGMTQSDLQMAQETMNSVNTTASEIPSALENEKVQNMLKIVYDIPYAYYITVFAFFFIGGYLFYGSLFAAVGSAVDNISDAQQFTLPITLPMIIGFLATFIFVMRDPDSTASFWFSIIPFTSPVTMMARIAFGVPTWELLLSMLLLVLGFVVSIWLAGRIYRIGILVHGTKVNFKTLIKWIKTNN